MTGPAWVWVARIELAFSRFQTERSTIEPHPCTGSGGRIRTFVARVKAACPTVGRLRNVSSLWRESNPRTRTYEARHPPRSTARVTAGGGMRSARPGVTSLLLSHSAPAGSRTRTSSFGRSGLVPPGLGQCQNFASLRGVEPRQPAS